MKYNSMSLKAEEFISHEEILETLAYADANKDNIALIDEIIEKAKLSPLPLPPTFPAAPG